MSNEDAINQVIDLLIDHRDLEGREQALDTLNRLRTELEEETGQ
jgi:hypothetical protein